MLEAFAACATELEHELVIAGSGPEEAALRELAQRLGIEDRVRFVGFVGRPWSLLREAELLLVASRWEGFGSAIIESLACGTPVVAMDVPYGPGEILDRLPYGELVPDGDTMAFAHAITYLLGDPGRLACLSREAATRARAEYSVVRMVEAYERLVDGIALADRTSSQGEVACVQQSR